MVQYCTSTVVAPDEYTRPTRPVAIMANTALATALATPSSPARAVLETAEKEGPVNGWRDGWLSFRAGFLEPNHGDSLRVLRRCAGIVWWSTAEQLPPLVQHCTVRARLEERSEKSSEGALRSGSSRECDGRSCRESMREQIQTRGAIASNRHF